MFHSANVVPSAGYVDEANVSVEGMSRHHPLRMIWRMTRWMAPWIEAKSGYGTTVL
jgi:hypothetical protein